MNEEDIWNKELQAICDMPCCLFRSSFNVGSPTDLTGDPTKRVKLRADIWPDQPDVPAALPEIVPYIFPISPVVTRTIFQPLQWFFSGD